MKPSFRDYEDLKHFTHDFRRINYYADDNPTLRKPKPGFAKWWCGKCDTIVMFPLRLTANDVNRKMSEHIQLPCVGEMKEPIKIS